MTSVTTERPVRQRGQRKLGDHPADRPSGASCARIQRVTANTGAGWIQRPSRREMPEANRMVIREAIWRFGEGSRG